MQVFPEILQHARVSTNVLYCCGERTPGVLPRADGRGYMFRLALSMSDTEADRANNAFSGELKEEDGIELRLESTQLLKLNIPTQSVKDS